MMRFVAIFLSGALVGATCMASLTPPLRCGSAYAAGAVAFVCR